MQFSSWKQEANEHHVTYQLVMGHPPVLRGAQFKNQCLLLCFKEIHIDKILCLSQTHIHRHSELCFTLQTTQPEDVLATNETQL